MKKILLLVLLVFNISIHAQEDTIIEETIIEEVKPASSEELLAVPFRIIEEVPIYPLCEDRITREEKKKCLNISIQKHIQRHFNLGILDCLNKIMVINEVTGQKELKCITGISPGKKRIYVQFKIGKTGEIEDINVRAPHPKLKEEAYRIAKLLPKMIPGKEKGKPVRVGYTIPITFNVE